MKSDDAKHLLEELETLNYSPQNKWEEDFLAGIQDHIDCGKQLSPKQGDKLQDIYRRASERNV